MRNNHQSFEGTIRYLFDPDLLCSCCTSVVNLTCHTLTGLPHVVGKSISKALRHFMNDCQLFIRVIDNGGPMIKDELLHVNEYVLLEKKDRAGYTTVASCHERQQALWRVTKRKLQPW